MKVSVFVTATIVLLTVGSLAYAGNSGKGGSNASSGGAPAAIGNALLNGVLGKDNPLPGNLTPGGDGDNSDKSGDKSGKSNGNSSSSDKSKKGKGK